MKHITKCGCKIEPGAWLYAECEHGLQWVNNEHGNLSPWHKKKCPVVVCLCGSTRFHEAFQQANYQETMKGNIVLTIGCDMKSDNDLFSELSQHELNEVKAKLDMLHLRKIDMADEVLILNVDGYIGKSTAKELAYAKAFGKQIRFLEPPSRT